MPENISLQYQTKKAKIDFLMQNLISPAKDEIRLRPLLERDSADKILLLIHSIYDGDDSEMLEKQQQQIDRLSNVKNYSDSTNNDVYNSHKPIICYNCGGKGHKRPECPSAFQAQRSDEETQKTHRRGQFRGRGRGYRGRYNQRGNRYQGRGAVVPSDSEEVKDKSPETEIVVENQSVIALIDTGSQVSTVTETYFNTLLQKKPILHDITKWMKVTGANDLPIPYLGYIELNISVAKTMIPNVGFLVVKDTDNISKLPFLLGNSPKISFVKIAGSSPVHIPGNSMKTVMCTTRQKDKNEKYCAIVQSLQGNQGALPRNIMVVDSYAEISQGTVPVRMINIGLEDVWINQKTRVGTLHSASLIHEVSQDNIDIDIKQTQINVQIKKINIAVCKQATTNVENNKKIQLNDLDIEKENLTDEQIEKVKDLLNKNTDIFCKNDLDLGYTDIVKHRILTTDEKPIAIPDRRIPPNQMEEVRAHIKQLLNQNIIRKSSSPYAAPVVIVRKRQVY
ncbi:unnamed protein product [Mytilus coruscus]|uniref:CCHC-type domain-containing protein n=1 Tax=Mytilus coruscus TaxID=42192 RepID=A0A6J8B867_MYTCO|nr:unnamed protein product [Mytilus coruscus]